MNDPRLLQISPHDNVCAATRALSAGEVIPFESGEIRIASDIPVGHKVAVSRMEVGDKVYKYGAPIGSATSRIEPGDHVHAHNLKSDYLPPAGRPDGSGVGRGVE